MGSDQCRLVKVETLEDKPRTNYNMFMEFGYVADSHSTGCWNFPYQPVADFSCNRGGHDLANRPWI